MLTKFLYVDHTCWFGKEGGGSLPTSFLRPQSIPKKGDRSRRGDRGGDHRTRNTALGLRSGWGGVLEGAITGGGAARGRGGFEGRAFVLIKMPTDVGWVREESKGSVIDPTGRGGNSPCGPRSWTKKMVAVEVRPAGGACGADATTAVSIRRPGRAAQ